MNETQQEEMQVACKKAINLFLMKGEQINSTMQRMIREVPELAPEAGTTSRSLSQHILERYWTKRDFAKVDGPFQIEGVGYSKNYKGRVKTGDSEEGHIDCGCSEDLALFELFWWKTWSIGSSHQNLMTFRENLKTDTIPPRLRAFFAAAYQEVSLLTLDDLFAIQWGEEGYENRLHTLQVMRKVTMLRSQGVEIPGFQLTSESSGISG
ncbi:uncharacterized protein LACBIDRAFT_334035 [Laccaria bicolor S238N-H82]|uniref:Predicted protein n=1 Tax=Laccaria bicolor (strain S238N-H82 / ATCC MYA-4686) TaxID=486041 RepID=B0DXV6_LACBS|nr:uncharacterized protein LACBIDRAFT_334035 [Laccaria bicolor S238N-H82]EDR00531.1 predicted protein [Laccaria bicolor S238N-H82]|eukprot:XP_001888758.1 predicted protein [Laccaria bicolor S238N-H82]